MRLAGIEVAEVAAPAATKAAASPAKASATARAETTASAKTSATEGSAKASPTSEAAKNSTLAALPALPILTAEAALHLDGLHGITEPVHIDACQRADLSSLAGNGDRLVDEVRVSGDGRQGCAAHAFCAGSGVSIGSERVQ